jgi:hypothetical protein
MWGRGSFYSRARIVMGWKNLSFILIVTFSQYYVKFLKSATSSMKGGFEKVFRHDVAG